MFIKEIILSTNKLEELKNFYTDILGLRSKAENENSLTIITGTSALTFKESKEINDPFYHIAFNIPENQFKKAKDWALQRADLIKLDNDDEFDFKSWNAHSIYFYDPSGNILELIARHNLNNSSSEEFSGESFLSISEIGLPVNDVENFYKEVNVNFDIPFFSGDHKNFCAMGDDNGLFIIVNNGRKWFPDCGYAKRFPVTVKIISDSKKEMEFEDRHYKVISLTE